MDQKDITDGFGPGDDERVVSILEKWKGGRLSTPLFTVLAGMIPTYGAETIIFRKINNQTEVLLLRRPKDDIVWKGMLNVPGSIIRRSDHLRSDKKPFESIFERIETQEIKTKFIKTPELIGPCPQMTTRGPLLVLVFLAQIKEDVTLPEGASWYKLESIKDNKDLIDSEKETIQLAADKFKQRQ